MIQNSLEKFKWGFFFIMLGIRIQGFDILPDIIGYLFFAFGLNSLRPISKFFVKASWFNLPMIFLSIFSIYQAPAHEEGIRLGPLGGIGIIISIASFVLNLLTIYNLFMGIKELEESRQNLILASESERMWNNYLLLEIAVLFSLIAIVIPIIGIFYIFIIIIAAIVVLIRIIRFLNECIDSLNQVP
ncbi:MAG: hypothetical protein ACOYIF_02560 [Acetivibrionales bacterium]|jgi:hypothetical protein